MTFSRVLCSNTTKPRTAVRLRTYEVPTASSSIKPTIWQACRATSAAPTLLPAIAFGTPLREFVDGGIGYNNPIRVLLDEVSQLWPQRAVGCLISIGAGRQDMVDVGKKAIDLVKTLVDMSTDTEQVEEEVAAEMSSKYGIDQRIYHRFNVDSGLEKVGLAEWEEFDRVTNCTEAYLKRQRDSVARCVNQLHDPQRT
jgi:predicted acylesterase/phospholipase RssA